jgi:signal transduction histidine kinase
MVSNVLSMRNIESGNLDMRVAPFDPRAAVRELLQVCRVGCHTRIAWPDEEAQLLPASVAGDRTFFIQILQNLVRLCALLRLSIAALC